MKAKTVTGALIVLVILAATARRLGMRRARLLFACLGILQASAPIGLSADPSAVIQVYFFRGEWKEGGVTLEGLKSFSAATHPEVAALRAKLDEPADIFQAAVADVILGLTDASAVHSLFRFGKPWRGEGGRRSVEVISSNDETFLFVFVSEPSPSRPAAVHVAIFKSSRGQDLLGASAVAELIRVQNSGRTTPGTDRILDAVFDLEMGEPVLASIPAERGAYLVCLALSSDADASPDLEFPGGPKAVRKVVPLYPLELRQRGIEGQVELKVAVDKYGRVAGVKVTKGFHPFLDNAAVQALRQWEFEPVLRNGVAVPAVLTTVVTFDGELYKRQEERLAAIAPRPDTVDESENPRLARILAGSAEYCRKLRECALDYICEETIIDVVSNLASPEEVEKSAVVTTFIGREGLITTIGVPPYTLARGRTERNTFVCDYLLIKEGDTIESRRIILEENGRALPDRSRRLEERRFSTLTPFLEPGRVLGLDRQPLYDYKLLKKDRVNGKDADVIEATPKLEDAGGIESSRIWIGRDGFRVLRMAVTGMPLEGYETILRELAQYNIRARFETTYQYRIERGGIAFPSRVDLRVNYPLPGLEPAAYMVKRIRTSLRYDKYKFFSVETESDIRRSPSLGPGLEERLPKSSS